MIYKNHQQVLDCFRQLDNIPHRITPLSLLDNRHSISIYPFISSDMRIPLLPEQPHPSPRRAYRKFPNKTKYAHNRLAGIGHHKQYGNVSTTSLSEQSRVIHSIDFATTKHNNYTLCACRRQHHSRSIISGILSNNTIVGSDNNERFLENIYTQPIRSAD